MSTQKSEFNTVTSKKTQRRRDKSKLRTNLPAPYSSTIPHGKCNGLTKFVAIADIILGLVTICILISSVACLKCYGKLDSGKTDLLSFIIVTSVIGCFFATINVYVAVSLFQALKPNYSRSKALNKANCWRTLTVIMLFHNFNWGFLVVAVGYHVRSFIIDCGVTNLVSFVIRVLFLIVINGLIDELEDSSSRDPQAMTA